MTTILDRAGVELADAVRAYLNHRTPIGALSVALRAYERAERRSAEAAAANALQDGDQ